MAPLVTVKKRLLVRGCNQLSSGFIAKGHLLPMSRQSRLSAVDTSDNDMISGAVHRSLGIYFIAKENSGKPQLENRLVKTCDQLSL